LLPAAKGLSEALPSPVSLLFKPLRMILEIALPMGVAGFWIASLASLVFAVARLCLWLWRAGRASQAECDQGLPIRSDSPVPAATP